MNHTEILFEVGQTLGSEQPKQALQHICKLLNQRIPKYTWVGFYFMNHKMQTLHLGPYVGAETEHISIPFGKGICGQVAVSGEIFVASDVASVENYIACSVDVKSEIVLPIYDNRNKLIAQLDIDSNLINAFTEEDAVLLKNICLEIGSEISDKLSYKDFI